MADRGGQSVSDLPCSDVCCIALIGFVAGRDLRGVGDGDITVVGYSNRTARDCLVFIEEAGTEKGLTQWRNVLLVSEETRCSIALRVKFERVCACLCVRDDGSHRASRRKYGTSFESHVANEIGTRDVERSPFNLDGTSRHDTQFAIPSEIGVGNLQCPVSDENGPSRVCTEVAFFDDRITATHLEDVSVGKARKLEAPENRRHLRGKGET